MIRLVSLFLTLTFLIQSNPMFAGPAKKFHARPVPQNLIEVEEALAAPNLLALYYLDMEYLIRVEKELLGENDSLALPTSTSKKQPADDSLIKLLGPRGFEVLQSVDYVIGGVYPNEKDAGHVQVVLGKFSAESVNHHLKEQGSVKPTEINGRPAWMWSPVDPESCKRSQPQVVIVGDNRLIIGDPDTVAWFLKRLNQPEAEKDLSEWRRYRQGKLLAFTVFIPENLNEVPGNGITRKVTDTVQQQMNSVTGVFGGLAVTTQPNGVELELLLQSQDIVWNQQWHNQLQNWKKQVLKDIKKDFKSVKNLLGYIDSEADNTKLVLRARFNENLLKDIQSVIQEGIDWFASSLSTSFPSVEINTPESIVPPKEIKRYDNLVLPEGMDPFDAQASLHETYAATSGPFGIQIKGISINPENKNVELKVEILSSPVPKLDFDLSSTPGEGIGGWFRITHVYDAKGRELMIDEPCGKDRNSKHVTLQKNFRHIDARRAQKTPTIKKLMKKNSGFSNIMLDVLKGSKTVRLKPGTLISDIRSIEGEAILQLPAKVIRRKITAPFENQVVQAKGLRIKMNNSPAGSVNFVASGEVHRLLEIRALNKQGKYLRSSTSMSSPLFFGEGISKSKQFQGKPQTAEFVFARESSKKTYPFQFKFKRPAFPGETYWKPVSVGVQSRASLLGQQFPKPRRDVCSSGSSPFKSGPFFICMNRNLSIRSAWQKEGKYATGTFLVHAQDTPAISGNLSAVQMVVEKVFVQKPGELKENTLAVHEKRFLTLDSNYAPPLKGAQFRLEAGPVKEEDGELTPLGFEGHLKIRLPRKLASFRMDLFELGSAAKAPNGLKVKFVGIEENRALLQIEGPRETLIHFTPLNLSGKPLNQREPRVKKLELEDKEIWQAEVRVPPETRYMDIVYAPRQETWDIPFRLRK